jgi:hypothetical protein
MKSSIQWWEPFSYIFAFFLFLYLRLPLIPYWWSDLQSDFSMVGIMAQHTKQGIFPIYFYGQNYMGGLEWLTAAIFSTAFDREPYISQAVLRINSLSWWFAAGLVWVLALRKYQKNISHIFAWFFALGTAQLLQVSVLQELSPQPLFFGGLLFSFFIGREKNRNFFWPLIGVILGISWWTNQSVVFLFLPILVVFSVCEEKWWKNHLWKTFFEIDERLTRLYWLGAIVIVMGILVALVGGLRIEAPFRLKIPNGISLARDAFLVVFFIHSFRKIWLWKKMGKVISDFSALLGFMGGFLLGFFPSWAGRVFGWYEKGYGVGLGIIPIFQWGSQFRALMLSLFELLFSQSFSLLMVICLFLLFSAFRISWKVFLSKRIVQISLSIFFFNLLYVMFSDRAEGAPIRYFYPAYLGFILFLSALLLEQQKRIFRAVFITGVLFAFLFVSWQEQKKLIDKGNRWIARKQQLESVQKLLQAGEYTHCWGDYWTSHLFAYLMQEHITFAPHPDSPATQVRLKREFDEVKIANPSCYLYRESSEATAKVLFSDQNPWRRGN